MRFLAAGRRRRKRILPIRAFLIRFIRQIETRGEPG
jgi:hypothetical protein